VPYPQSCAIPLLLLTLILPVSCLRDSTTMVLAAGSSTGTVSVVDDAFEPRVVTISAGQTVTWEWHGAALHDVTFDDSSIGDSAAQRGGSFQRTFVSAGEFTYYCTIHGRSVMLGKITVRSAG